MTETAALVTGIAFVKRELDQIDAQIREHQVCGASMQKLIAASVEKKKELTQKIGEVQHEIIAMQTKHQHVRTIHDYRKSLWRSEVEEMECLQGQLRKDRQRLREQVAQFETHHLRLTKEMSQNEWEKLEMLRELGLSELANEIMQEKAELIRLKGKEQAESQQAEERKLQARQDNKVQSAEAAQLHEEDEAILRLKAQLKALLQPSNEESQPADSLEEDTSGTLQQLQAEIQQVEEEICEVRGCLALYDMERREQQKKNMCHHNNCAQDNRVQQTVNNKVQQAGYISPHAPDDHHGTQIHSRYVESHNLDSSHSHRQHGLISTTCGSSHQNGCLHSADWAKKGDYKDSVTSITATAAAAVQDQNVLLMKEGRSGAIVDQGYDRGPLFASESGSAMHCESGDEVSRFIQRPLTTCIHTQHPAVSGQAEVTAGDKEQVFPPPSSPNQKLLLVKADQLVQPSLQTAHINNTSSTCLIATSITPPTTDIRAAAINLLSSSSLQAVKEMVITHTHHHSPNTMVHKRMVVREHRPDPAHLSSAGRECENGVQIIRVEGAPCSDVMFATPEANRCPNNVQTGTCTAAGGHGIAGQSHNATTGGAGFDDCVREGFHSTQARSNYHRVVTPSVHAVVTIEETTTKVQRIPQSISSDRGKRRKVMTSEQAELPALRYPPPPPSCVITDVTPVTTSDEQPGKDQQDVPPACDGYNSGDNFIQTQQHVMKRHLGHHPINGCNMALLQTDNSRFMIHQKTAQDAATSKAPTIANATACGISGSIGGSSSSTGCSSLLSTWEEDTEEVLQVKTAAVLSSGQLEGCSYADQVEAVRDMPQQESLRGNEGRQESLRGNEGRQETPKGQHVSLSTDHVEKQQPTAYSKLQPPVPYPTSYICVPESDAAKACYGHGSIMSSCKSTYQNLAHHTSEPFPKPVGRGEPLKSYSAAVSSSSQLAPRINCDLHHSKAQQVSGQLVNWASTNSSAQNQGHYLGSLQPKQQGFIQNPRINSTATTFQCVDVDIMEHAVNLPIYPQSSASQITASGGLNDHCKKEVSAALRSHLLLCNSNPAPIVLHQSTCTQDVNTSLHKQQDYYKSAHYVDDWHPRATQPPPRNMRIEPTLQHLLNSAPAAAPAFTPCYTSHGQQQQLQPPLLQRAGFSSSDGAAVPANMKNINAPASAIEGMQNLRTSKKGAGFEISAAKLVTDPVTLNATVSVAVTNNCHSANAAPGAMHSSFSNCHTANAEPGAMHSRFSFSTDCSTPRPFEQQALNTVPSTTSAKYVDSLRNVWNAKQNGRPGAAAPAADDFQHALGSKSFLCKSPELEDLPQVSKPPLANNYGLQYNPYMTLPAVTNHGTCGTQFANKGVPDGKKQGRNGSPAAYGTLKAADNQLQTGTPSSVNAKATTTNPGVSKKSRTNRKAQQNENASSGLGQQEQHGEAAGQKLMSTGQRRAAEKRLKAKSEERQQNKPIACKDMFGGGCVWEGL